MTETALSKSDNAASPLLLIAAGASAALFVANLYYAQPLLTTIAADIHIHPQYAGAVVGASQLGYGMGLFLLVPLVDIIENRRLVLTCIVLTLIGIVGVACASSALTFLFCALVIGIFSSGAQVLIPYLSLMIPKARLGRVMGSVMSGILASVMFARPFALFAAAAWGWRSVYILSAAATAVLGVALWWIMPPRQPQVRIAYWRTIVSMFALFVAETPVWRRTMYQAVLFGCFTMFWATFPILLAEHFGFGKPAIGLFALVGAGGVLAAPLAGRIAERGAIRTGTIVAALCVSGAFLCSALSVQFGAPFGIALMALWLAATSLVIDGSIQVSQVLSRIVVLEVPPEVRGRINAVYMTVIFLCGAIGSAFGVTIYYHAGWLAVATVGMVGGLVVFMAALAEGQTVFRLSKKDEAA
ncbi:MFS transporter [Sphingobium fluviale]|nr:MFS transporter [Sphingobium fluviale]